MSVFEIVIIAVVVFVIVFTFFGPQWWFDRVFPDSVQAISLVIFMAKESGMNAISGIHDEKTVQLLITWELMTLMYKKEGREYDFKLSEKGEEFVEKYQNSKYGLRLFVIGKLVQRLLKFVLPFIGANILFVWYKYFENYLEKLFDMCP